jgi:hypothetical protein
MLRWNADAGLNSRERQGIVGRQQSLDRPWRLILRTALKIAYPACSMWR